MFYVLFAVNCFLLSLRLNSLFCQMILAMTIAAGKSAIDPEFCQLHRVRVSPLLRVKGGPTSAEDGNPFLHPALRDEDGRSGDPFTRANFLR